MQVHRYISKISGPLLDRIDIQIEVPAIKYSEIAGEKQGESSEKIRERIKKAREIQWERFKKSQIHSNAHMNHRQIKKHCALNDESKKLLEDAIDGMGLSARAYDRILKVARTITDIAGEDNIGTEAVSEAIQYRSLDRMDGFN